jgi:subtilisin family serine protease
VLLALLPVVAQARLPVVDTSKAETVSARMYPHADRNGRTVMGPDLAISGQLLVQFTPSARPADLGSALRNTGCRLLHIYDSPGLVLVALPEGMAVREGAALWAGQMGVTLAAPDKLAYRTLAPNDPLYSQQYHHPLMDSELAWGEQTGSASVVTAIIDDGVDLTHEDLASRIWVNADDTPGNGVDDDGNGYVDDVNGWDFANSNNDPNPESSQPGNDHGTHVAGCAAATGNNGVGVAGVDWGCRIMALQVFDAAGGSSASAIIGAIDYARANGAKVINMSLTGGYTDIYTSPVSAAWAAGVSVVVAAGNYSVTFTDDPLTWFSPVCNDGPSATDNHVIGVGATDAADMVASFSHLDGSSHKFVDVMAPGVDVLSTLLYRPADGYTEAYGKMSGTSMACPVTAGVVALMRAQYPGYSPDAITAQLRSGCENIDGLNPASVGKMGAGRVNVANSLGDMPPGPPRSVQAFDTPGDEGGSITVTWSLSADDGKGASDVVTYEVRRADAAGGPFAKIGDVPNGSKTYLDTDVVDYTDYYYQVAARDAVNVTAATPVGPAQAKDDLAPPAVTLIASDTPADDGGSITLSWVSYAAPDDFLQYRVYRSEAEFDSINDDGVTQLTTISSRSTRTYLDHSVVNNEDYWYAVTAVDDAPEPNELTAVTAAGPVRANPNFTMVYPAGLSMCALGLDTTETDLGVLFGRTPPGADFARWDPSQGETGAYHLYSADPTDSFLAQALGRGFWMKTSQAVLVSVSGAPSAGDMQISFVAGWNQLGNPFDEPVAIADMRVKVSGVTYDLPTAEAKGHGAGYFWTYDNASGGYRLVSQSHSFARPDVLKGEGFFFFANRAGQLLVPKPVTAAGAKAPSRVAAAPSDANWNLQLVAAVQGAADTDNFLGVSPQAARLNGVASPPLVPDGVDLYFPAEGGHHATSYRGELGQGQSWSVRVAAAAGSAVHLSWPDLSQLPGDCYATLEDLAAGKRVYLRTSNGYDFALGTGETERQFTLKISAKAGDLLAIRSLSAQPAAKAVHISYTLSAPAAVSVDILNLAGRLVRSLPETQQDGGVVTALWDGNGGSGTKAPAGTYLVRLTARGADGQAVSAVRTVRLP